MLEKNAGWILPTAALALTLAGCSGGGSGGSGFQVATCTLGCSGGAGGEQITCGVVGVAENQEISLTFTSNVDIGSVTKESFAVRDAITGASAAGTRFIDPNNPKRLVFRPKLTVSASGSPLFGFETGRAYEIYLNGTVQKDPQPYVRSIGGSANAARVNCTVEANQGIVDLVPGKPEVAMFVTQVQPVSNAETVVEVALGQTPGAMNVKTFSNIRFEFNELMDISTIFNPTTGVASNIAVLLDIDGNPLTTNDRAPIQGSYTYGYDQGAQTTTLIFTPANGFPSLGANPSVPRLVVATLGPNIADIAGNGLAVPGTYNFAPQQLVYPPATLPPGGEQFSDVSNLDAPYSGSPWGTEVAGRLTPGEGGGSGRHGELIVPAGQTMVLHSSAARASMTIEFLKGTPMQPIPKNNDVITIAGVDFTFKTTATAATHVPIRYDVAQGGISYTLSTLIDTINAYALANPGSQVASASYTLSSFDKLKIEALTPGIPSPPFAVSISPAPGNQLFAISSSGSLAGGFVAHVFADPEIVTNFDFSAGTGIPGGTPPDLVVDDGVFEFSRVEVEPTATLLLTGDAPVRLLSRGEFVLSDLATIDLAGEDRPSHFSHAPRGQPGGAPGPAGGAGGRGGDRSNQPDQANSNGLGVMVANPVLNGSDGVGVGAAAGVGQGRGGVRWPNVFPTWPTSAGGWLHNSGCQSGIMANTGSGGAYALDGAAGNTQVVFATGTASNTSMISNKPVVGNTVGGSAAAVGLEPPSANPTAERLLTPSLGYLRGGAGGGGAGAHVGNTLVQGFGTGCFTSLFLYQMWDNSGAGGGGGGGALQVQAGGTLQLTGQIVAGGGDGGDYASSTNISQNFAAPGGGGAGGAVLLQGGTLDLSNQPSRILVNGGAGGEGGYVLTPSIGGKGSPGLVRVEQAGLGNGPDALDVAPIVFPTDPMDPTSVNWLSTGDWLYDGAKADEIEAVTGSQSCWMQVPGTHFSLTFQGDPVPPAAPAAMGWNMDVILDDGMGGEITVPWRGSDGAGPFLGLYPEEQWGTLLNRELGMGESAAPIVVRFQGANVEGTLQFPCDVDENDPNGGIEVGSLTPWVRQPEELNPYLPLPRVLRFLVLFDRSHPDFGMIKGVTNLRVEVQPE